MNWTNPRRTFESVVDELAEGLGNGTIVLSERAEEPPLVDREELLKIPSLLAEVVVPREQRSSGTQKHKENSELPEDIQETEPQSLQEPDRLIRPAQTGEPDVIGKGLFIKGEISGGEALFIDGKVEGSINLNGSRVTVGRDGQVAASITARDVVVQGKVRGNVTATDRVDIRAEGVLSGDVAAARISIEDGAVFKGGIAICKLSSLEDEFQVGLSVRARVEEEKFA